MRRQNTVAQYISIRPILDLCEESVRRPGMRFSKWRREQGGLELEEAREAATAVESTAGEIEGSEGEAEVIAVN